MLNYLEPIRTDLCTHSNATATEIPARDSTSHNRTRLNLASLYQTPHYLYQVHLSMCRGGLTGTGFIFSPFEDCVRFLSDAPQKIPDAIEILQESLVIAVKVVHRPDLLFLARRVEVLSIEHRGGELSSPRANAQ